MTLVARALRAWPAACRPCRGNPCQHLDGREWVVARGDTVHMYRLRRGFVTKAEFDAAHAFGFPCAQVPRG